MHTYLVMDIETVANERSGGYFQKKTYEPAANLKDPKKIEQSVLERRQKDTDKAALHWWTGKVICASVAVLGSSEVKPKTFYGADEKSVLIGLFDYIFNTTAKFSNTIVIGKSSDFFDLPFLVGRALYHDLGILQNLRPYRPVTDIDQIFSYSSQCEQRSNLSNYAFGLNIAGKINHGSNVGGIYCEIQMGDTDKWKDIYEYCESDRDIVKAILTRWLKPYTPSVTLPDNIDITDIPF